MVVVVDLASQSHFFIEAAMGLGIGRVIGLVISRAILIGTDIIVGFSRLSM